jgi:SulP family sulfate permease
MLPLGLCWSARLTDCPVCMYVSSKLARFFPFLRWARPDGGTLRRDVVAGITVGLVLVPQALAYAALAGMPLHTGLYAALLPGVIGVLWGSSPLLAAGPTALSSILVFGSLAALATPESDNWVTLTIWLALYSGLIQVLLGAFKTGKITYLVSQPVIIGFINAAAVIIILSQVPHLFGIDFARGWSATLAAISDPSPAQLVTTAFGLGALALLLLIKRFTPRLPGALIVTLLGIAGSWLLDYASYGARIVGALPQSLPDLSLPPAISLDSHRELLPAALILALLSFTEAMSSARVLSRKRNEAWDENQELIGQGLAKMSSGLCGAFPVSGSFSRSALNLYAGAVTGWANLVSVLCVLFSLLFLTDVLSYLPYSVLAALIIVPVLNLLDPAAFKRLFVIANGDGWVALVTFIATLAFMPRLHMGVFAGVGLTMVIFLYRRTHPRVIEVAEHADGTMRDRQRFDLAPLAPDVLAVRMDSTLDFLTGATLERFINEVRVDRPGLRRILLCANGINNIDASGVDAIESLYTTLRSEGITLHVSAVKKQVWDVLERAGAVDLLGRQCFYATDRLAISALRQAGPSVAAAESVRASRTA